MTKQRKNQLARLQEEQLNQERRELQTELASAEHDARRLADFFDLERDINRSMESDIYRNREGAYGDWYNDQLGIEENNCARGVDMKKHTRLEARLRDWLGDKIVGHEKMFRELLGMIALPDEIRLIQLIRLDVCRHRVRDLSERIRSMKQVDKRAA